ncbi:MAG: ABC transporter transmembrane domain-containing protein, partial [Acidimicrobiia bacterium]
MDVTTPMPTGQALRRAIREAPALGRGLRLTVGLAVAGTAIQVVVPVVLQQIVDHEILGPEVVDLQGVLRRGAVAALALLAGLLLSRAALLRLVRSSAAGLSDLRVKTFGQLLRLSMLNVQAERRGVLVARVTSDIATLQEFMEWGGVGFLIGSAQVLLALGMMFFYEWRLALLVLAGTIVYAGLMIWFQRILRRSYDRVRGAVGDSLAVLGEAVSALPVIRAYGVELTTT